MTSGKAARPAFCRVKAGFPTVLGSMPEPAISSPICRSQIFEVHNVARRVQEIVRDYALRTLSSLRPLEIARGMAAQPPTCSMSSTSAPTSVSLLPIRVVSCQ